MNKQLRDKRERKGVLHWARILGKGQNRDLNKDHLSLPGILTICFLIQSQ